MGITQTEAAKLQAEKEELLERFNKNQPLQELAAIPQFDAVERLFVEEISELRSRFEVLEPTNRELFFEKYRTLVSDIKSLIRLMGAIVGAGRQQYDVAMRIEEIGKQLSPLYVPTKDNTLRTFRREGFVAGKEDPDYPDRDKPEEH